MVVAVLPGIGEGRSVGAQDAMPLASPTAGAATIVASGLTNPLGMAWDAGGVLHVALAGNSGTSPAAGTPTT